MSLAEHFTPPASNCKFARLRDTLNADDRDVLDSAMGDTAFSSVHIGRALRSEGHQIAEDSVRRHRTGACSCP
jgi:hypothetical protein